MMKSCREVTRLLSDEQDRVLSFNERMLLKIHTFMCSACSNYGKQVQILRQVSHTFTKGKTGVNTELQKEERNEE
jgi:hypothetical protein